MVDNCIIRLFLISLSVTSLRSFAFLPNRNFERCHNQKLCIAKSSTSTSEPQVGDLLGDLATPSLLLELSLAENSIEASSKGLLSLDNVLSGGNETENNFLEGCIFVHTSVLDTSIRDAITKVKGSGASHIICQVDVSSSLVPGGAILGIGLANHHVGGYYWARGMGMGATLPAHGIYYRSIDDSNNDSPGELYWKRRGAGTDAFETTEESSNSNDGKRSEWADFLGVGDTVQLVPKNISKVLYQSPFQALLGVRRVGRPLGADPIVEKIWVRNEDGWVAIE
jgi:hypothetical protein